MDIHCTACNAPLQIEDETCPYCGSPNPYFQKERDTLEDYHEELAETQEEVYTRAKQSSRVVGGITLICILVTLNVAAFLLQANSWSIERFFINQSIDKNRFTHEMKLDAFIEEKDYIGFVKYYDNHSLYINESLEYYDTFKRVATAYCDLQENLLEATVWYAEHTYVEPEEYAKRIWENLNSFYKYQEQDEYDDPAQFSPTFLQAMADAEKQLNALLCAYANLSPETVNTLRDVSKAQRAIIIEEGVLSYEQVSAE